MCFDRNNKLFLETRLELSSPSKEDNILAKFCHSAPLLLLIGIRWTDWGHRLRPCGSTAPRRTVFSLWQVCHNISKAEAEANFINELGSKQKEVGTLPSNTGMYILCMYVYLVCICTHTSVEDSAMNAASCAAVAAAADRQPGMVWICAHHYRDNWKVDMVALTGCAPFWRVGPPVPFQLLLSFTNSTPQLYILLPTKVIHPKYYKHLKKGAHQSHLGRH